jgi:hypothetical protein
MALLGRAGATLRMMPKRNLSPVQGRCVRRVAEAVSPYRAEH